MDGASRPKLGGPKQRAHLEKTESALRSNREREIASLSLNGCGQFLKTVQIEAVVPICDKSENVVICGTREEYPNLKSHVSISKTVLSGEEVRIVAIANQAATSG